MKYLIYITALLISINVYGKCEHSFVIKDAQGKPVTFEAQTMKRCYAKNYTNYTPKEAANEFLSNQVFVKGGRFNLNNNPKTHTQMKSFYIGKYLVPFQQYNAYLKATGKWNHGIVNHMGIDNNARKSFDTYNGLYPATATYKNAQGFCQWMGKLTGLDVELPQYVQWLYAATSKGDNWDYPTDNGKLELGKNFPATPIKKGDDNEIMKVNDFPVNSLGIHQIFGNGMQWTQSTLTKSNAPYFKVWSPSGFGGKIAGGTYYPTSVQDESILKKMTLSSNFARAQKPDDDTEISFRCVINTDKPIPKHLDEVKSGS